MANDKDFRVKNGLLVATDTTDLNSQGQIINSGSLGSFINFVDINTEFPETKATIGGNIDLDFSAYSYKINDNNMLWHGEGYVDTNTVVGKNAGTTTDYTSSNLTLLGHGAEPSSPTATNEVTLGDSNVKSFRIPGVGMSVDSTGLLTVNDISISGDITIDSDLVVNTIQVNDSARVTGNFTVDSDILHVDATYDRVGIGTTSPATALDVTGTVTADGLNLGDNEYIQLGASNDLQIYHSGTNSFITETGTGDLNINAQNLSLADGAPNFNYYFRGIAGQDVRLYYNGLQKLATTSTGVDVTGTVTADQYNTDEALPTSNPSLSLDFGNSVQVDPRINFSRASIGTYFDGQYIRTAGPDEPRIEYDSDGTVKGLLIEEQRENLIQHSEDFSQSYWLKQASGTGSTPVVAASSLTDPAGGTGAYEVAFDAGAGTSGGDTSMFSSTSIASTSGVDYTHSIWVRGDVGGEQIVVRGVGNSAFDLFTLTTDWTRISATETATPAAGYLNFGIRQAVQGTINSTATVHIYGAQLEEGSFATSYIPTNGTEVTREPDIAYMPVSEFNYNQSAGTVMVDFATLATFGSRTNDGVFSLRDNSTDKDDVVRLYLVASDNLSVQVLSNNSSVFAVSALNDLPEQSQTKVAIGFTSGSYAAAVDGGTATELSTDTAFPVAGEITELAIGEINGSDFLNGHIKSLKYWPQRLSDATLQAVTQG
jgi:hypothetical protein